MKNQGGSRERGLVKVEEINWLPQGTGNLIKTKYWVFAIPTGRQWRIGLFPLPM
jgi:hypothetical protein